MPFPETRKKDCHSKRTQSGWHHGRQHPDNTCRRVPEHRVLKPIAENPGRGKKSIPEVVGRASIRQLLQVSQQQRASTSVFFFVGRSLSLLGTESYRSS